MSVIFSNQDSHIDRIARLQSKITELELSVSELRHECTGLQERIKLYTGMINTIPDFIIQTDLNGGIIFVNDCTVHSTGLSREEIEGRNILVFLSPDERVKAISNAMFMLQERQGLNEFTLTMKEGQRVPFEINGDVLLDINGEPTGFIFLCRDITNRRQSERMVKSIEERMKGITANMPGIVFQFCAEENGEYRINYVSEKVVEYSGIQSADLDELYSSFINSIHEEDINGFLISIRSAVSEAGPWNYIFRYVSPGGDVLWLHGLSLPSYRDNEIIFSGILLDISDFKKAENMSRLSEEKFSRIFMTVPDCIAITRLSDGFVIDVNTGFEDITGWKREEASGKFSTGLGFWADTDERDYLKTELEAGREVIGREFRFRRKDGGLRSGIYSARSIQIREEACLVIVIRDTTEMKLIEAESLRLEQHLLHAQKMDAIGQLAGGVAHDFNNILMAIQGNTSLMLMHCGPDDYNYQRLMRIDESIRRGSNLTKQLLGFARGGKYELKVLSVNDFINRSIHFFIETRREIEAELDLQENVYPVEMDPDQIEQVLLNLFINAAQAMPGGGRIYLQTSNVIVDKYDADIFSLAEGNYVKISISDNGIGMTEETLSRIFEPFFTTKSAQGGTGLGLASAYGIIQNHGGMIKAYSEPGHGTTFNIYLPSSDKNVVCEDLPASPELLQGSGVILVVDDEQPILDFALELLNKLGYTVFTARRGMDAIDILREKKDAIDLVIMDMIMPGINGLMLIRELRRINSEVKIILSSGYSLQGEIQKAIETGCQGFIQKPFKMSDFLAAVNKALNERLN